MGLSLDAFSRALGESYTPEEIVSGLSAYGVKARVEGGVLSARCPSYRDDYLHAMDVVEDFAVAMDGETIGFCMMANNYTVPTSMANRLQDQVCERLANFTRAR